MLRPSLAISDKPESLNCILFCSSCHYRETAPIRISVFETLGLPMLSSQNRACYA